MQYFKTFEGMITSQFEQDGEKDDKGNLIKATEKPISESEFTETKKVTITEKVNRYEPGSGN